MKLQCLLSVLLGIFAISSIASAGILIPAAFEQKVITAQEIENPQCSDIDISTYTISLSAGQGFYDSFYIENKSNSIFEITGARVLENDSEIDSTAYSVDGFIPRQGNANLTIATMAMQGIESKATTAYAQISGFFPSIGKQCGFSSISESFMISLKGVERQNSNAVIASFSGTYGGSDYWGYSQPSYSSSSYEINDSYNITDSYNAIDSYNTTYNYAQAMPLPRQEPKFMPKTSCSNISIYTKNFYLGSNDSRTQNFIVKNDSEKTFFIESIQAFDDNPNFIAKALKASGTSISAHNSITVPVSAESFAVAKSIESSGTFKVSGVFSDNSICSPESIGSASFQVQVIAKEQEQPNANGFQLFFPETVKVSQQGTQFTITIINATGKSGYIKVYSPDAIVDPQAVVIPATANSTNAVITVKGLDKNSAWLFYDFFFDSFNIPSKVSRLEKSIVSITPISRPLPQPTPTQLPQPNINIDSSIQPQPNGSYDLNIVVKNETNIPVSGSIEINVPNNWSIEGNTNVSLGAFESKTIQLKARPEGFNEKDIQTTIEFKAASGARFSEPILLKANKPAFAAVFAVLGANAFLLGIIILIVIVLIAVYYAGSKDAQKTSALKEQWIQAQK